MNYPIIIETLKKARKRIVELHPEGLSEGYSCDTLEAVDVLIKELSDTKMDIHSIASLGLTAMQHSNPDKFIIDTVKGL